MEMIRIVRALKRLNDLQAKPPPPWVDGLTGSELEMAVEHARTGIPHSILVHHDDHVSHGRRSLSEVRRGGCGSCGMKLRADHRARPDPRGGLHVCERCGVFLVWPENETTTAPERRARK